MWPDLLDQQPVSITDLGQRRIGRGGSQGVRNAAQLLDTSPDALVLTLEAPGERGVPRAQADGPVPAGAQRAQGVEDHRPKRRLSTNTPQRRSVCVLSNSRRMGRRSSIP